jgi:hypothetical protein
VPQRERALVWRANYHPDGGQLFYPLHGEGFIVPLALPGDDVTPEQFVSFYCDGKAGLYTATTGRAGTLRLLPWPSSVKTASDTADQQTDSYPSLQIIWRGSLDRDTARSGRGNPPPRLRTSGTLPGHLFPIYHTTH